jgi:hypothetical protein
MRFVKLAEFRRRYFEAESAPSERTLRRQVEAGELPGRRMGKLYYVDLHKWLAEGDALVERTLAG